MVTNWFHQKVECHHEATVSVVSSGIQRDICEGCGNVSLRDRHEAVVGGSPDRSKFAREADKRATAAHLAHR
jgi:hypothetical protein